MPTLPWGIALIVAGMAWSCGNGLGFSPPDEEDLADTWYTPILDGDYSKELEFTREGDANIFIRREVDYNSPDLEYIETQRGTYVLSPQGDQDVPSIRFEPDGEAPSEFFILYFDATTLDLGLSADQEPDLEFPSYQR